MKHENPVLIDYIQKLKEDLEEKRNQINERDLSIKAATKERAEANRLQDTNARIARVVGRVSLYLETIEFDNNFETLNNELSETKNLIAYYDEILDKSKIEANINSSLNQMSLYMTAWAKQMQLEHSHYSYVLDLNKLTVIANRPGRPISMGHGGMGGGENWLGCHVITHLALHKYFIENNRPVPGFLFLDQPSQVYFPSEIYKNMQGKKEEISKQDDRYAVNRLFELLIEVCESLYPDLQIIVTEHANLDTAKFQEALVEEPWSGEGKRALIPEDWYS